MKDPEKIDFGPLDPARDAPRWQRLIDETARRARAQRGRGAQTMSAQVVAWGRPVLAVAAALSLVAWGSSRWGADHSVDRGRAVVRSEQAARLLEWALRDEVPPPEVVLQVVGGAHDQP
jgi:hypothetical protein